MQAAVKIENGGSMDQVITGTEHQGVLIAIEPRVGGALAPQQAVLDVAVLVVTVPAIGGGAFKVEMLGGVIGPIDRHTPAVIIQGAAIGIDIDARAGVAEGPAQDQPIGKAIIRARGKTQPVIVEAVLVERIVFLTPLDITGDEKAEPLEGPVLIGAGAATALPTRFVSLLQQTTGEGLIGKANLQPTETDTPGTAS